MKSALVRTVLALIIGGALTGCAPFSMYRTDLTTCMGVDTHSLDTRCANNAIQVLRPDPSAKPVYVLGFIEFDDQGQLWDRRQMHAVLDSVDAQTANGGTDFLMVVFVHGWKHNASVADTNIASFREALTELNATENELSRKVGRPARQVIGIYVGWRGASATTPVIEDLTFWERKSTAHKVGHGQVTEVFDRLEVIQQQRIQKDPQSRSRLIVVGHSFGGAVVFSALEQILESRFTQSGGAPANPDPVRGFGNLVVLINPAFEAQLYAPLSDLANEQAAYAKSQLPVLAILTSVADSATGVAFPIGRWFSTWFEKQRPVPRDNPITHSTDVIDQHKADVDAVGHFESYRTHSLIATRAPGTPNSAAVPLTPNQKTRSLAASSQQWEDDQPGSMIAFPGSLLTRTTNSAGRNPYLVVNVDKQLIADHNDIWRPGIREFLTHLILISSQSENLQERAEHREAAAQ